MKRISSIIFILILTTSCARISIEQKDFNNLKDISILKESIFNGKIKKVNIHYPFKSITAKLFCGDQEIVLGPLKDEHRQVFISSDRHVESGELVCEYRFKVDGEDKKLEIAKLQIENSKYPLKKIKVAKKYAKLSKKNIERWKRESKRLEKVYNNAIVDRKLFEKEFKRPLSSKITAVYGSKRVFNDMKHSWHSGIDFRARTRVKIPASNRGKVVLARHHFFTGKTIIIDHGMGIMTMYCHLSSLKSSEGDIVPQGEIIGISGNTGRSSGPHLHWGVRVNGHWVDGFSLLKEGI